MKRGQHKPSKPRQPMRGTNQYKPPPISKSYFPRKPIIASHRPHERASHTYIGRLYQATSAPVNRSSAITRQQEDPNLYKNHYLLTHFTTWLASSYQPMPTSSKQTKPVDTFNITSWFIFSLVGSFINIKRNVLKKYGPGFNKENILKIIMKFVHLNRSISNK